MTKEFYLILLLLLPFEVCSQIESDFEDISISSNSFLNDSGSDQRFLTGSIDLPNSYDSEFDSWLGWAISNKKDSITEGFTNQYSSIAASGFGNSENYAVGFAFDPLILAIQTGQQIIEEFSNIYVNNSTFAYKSMKNGDAFAKRFGGETGDDPDFLVLSIKSIDEGVFSSDSINFYLADYRFTDNSQDYLIKDWTAIDLSSLGNIDSLAFQLFSSDVGQFGMNTPAYFCLDQVSTQIISSTGKVSSTYKDIKIFPNPVSHTLYMETDESWDLIQIIDNHGNIIFEEYNSNAPKKLDVESFASGIHFFRGLKQHKIITQRFIVVK